MPAFTNQATLSYNGQSVTSNIITGQLVDVITAAKNAVMTNYTAATRMTYVISIQNSGATAYTGLTVTDDLGAYTFGTGTVVPLTYEADSLRYYVNGDLMPALTPTATSPLTVTGINVPAGGNAMLIYEAVTNNFAPLDVGGTITNTATVSGTGIANAVTAEETVTVGTDPTLTIGKSMTPSTVTENGTLTYTFVIENTGNTEADATAGVIVTDTFNPILTGLTVTLNGTALASPTQYSYNQATGAFATVAGVITVPAATYTQDTTTGAYDIQPGTATLVVSGTV